VGDCWKLFHENLSLSPIWIYEKLSLFEIWIFKLPSISFITFCPTSKSYEYFVCFIRIYHAPILVTILSINVLVMLVASPSASVVACTHVCRLVALDTLSTFTLLHTRLLITCVSFLMYTTAFLTIIFLNT